MTHALIKVESFQTELAKRILKRPKHHSNNAAMVVVGMETVRSTILERKLGFLHRVLNTGSKCVSPRLEEAMFDRVSVFGERV